MITKNPDVTLAKDPRPEVDFIADLSGRDGDYLAELLLEKGYIVHGIKRRALSFIPSAVNGARCLV